MSLLPAWYRGRRPDGTGRPSTSGQPESGTELSRGDFLRGAALLALPVLVGSTLGRPRPAAAAAPYRPLAIGAERLQQVRRNVFELELPFAQRAWANTLAKANEWLGYRPNPTRPDADLSDWFNAVYRPGLHDGNAALTLAVAYAVGGRKEHADRAKAICLAWARTYRPVPAQHRIGHLVAEPVGPVVKLCMAYDLAKPAYSPQERKEFESWAAQFVERGERNADLARDRPWVADVTYGEDTTNAASYGNSATWQRAMALWAAAAVGGETLRSALWWNLRHTTSGGRDYGWDDLLEGMLLDGTGGRVAEDRYRSSIEYGHFSWIPLVLIADLARNAGFRVNLFSYRTSRHGYTLFTPVSYYAPYLVQSSVPDALERTQYGGAAWPTTAARWRAAYEVLYRNATDPADVTALRRVVNWGGAGQRGDNYDIYVLGHAALFGRGPKGPMPPPRKQPKKR